MADPYPGPGCFLRSLDSWGETKIRICLPSAHCTNPRKGVGCPRFQYYSLVSGGWSNATSSNQSSSHNVNGECLVSNLEAQLVLGSQQCRVVILPLAVCLLVGCLRCEIVHGTVLIGVRSFSLPPLPP